MSSLHSLMDAELEFIAKHMDILSPEEASEVEQLINELQSRQEAKDCRDDLIEFCKKMMPDYKVGKHHRMLADELMAIAEGKKDRVCVNIPPRHGKSQLVSIYYPAWFIGKFPNKKILMVSHTSDLAVDFGRKVRNIIDTPEYKKIFPTVTLAADSKSAGRWNTNSGGEYFACGVGSALAGRGADLLLIDDPHNEQDIINGNLDVFEKAYEWFTYGARTRLMPEGRVAIIQCMAGDTKVLMADGSEVEIKHLKIGSSVATYDSGKLAASKVLNWANQGSDCVYAITLSNGNILRANERHPFLVEQNGETKWVRVKDLRTGDSVVSLRDAQGPHEQPRSPESAALVNLMTAGIENTQTLRTDLLGTTGNGKESSAPQMGVQNPSAIAVCVLNTRLKPITTSSETKTNITARAKDAIVILSLNMGLTLRSTIGCLSTKITNALFARKGLTKWPNQEVGVPQTRSLLTTATPQVEYEDCCATPATSSSKPTLTRTHCGGLFTTSKVTSIRPDGYEDVFDIEVERTHNFIANSSVVSNTRWHQDDLTGRVVRDMTQNDETDQYEVVEFPAIFNENSASEKALWPEQYTLEALRRIKAGMPVFQWNAQYQQNPTGEEAAIVKREWWQKWKNENPPSCEYVIMALDAAAETNNRADFTAITTWGVFLNEECDAYHIILLNAIKKRVEFPELKDLAYEQYNEFEPDAFIVEKKSAGTALYQELRRTGMAVQEYTPHRGTGDKMARLNSVADIIRSGLVWVPETRWAEEVVEEMAAFPFGSNDDLVDTAVMALMRFRNGGFVRLPSDEPEDLKFFKQRKHAYY